ncbi:SDR family NAD(P)-dependent oxidoreductase, partial [Symbiobacterium terraclitae]
MRFADKVVVVTGAARGIGRATALAFAAEGARVLGADVDPLPVDGVEMHRCDVADEEQVRGFLNQVGPVLHVLVNNAGISQFGPLESTP